MGKPANPQGVKILNTNQIAKAIDKIALQILEKHPDPRDLCLVGVHSGGDLLIRRVEKALSEKSGVKDLDLPKGMVEISFYRDDFTRLSQVPVHQATNIPFDPDDRTIILIDDVLFTGRTIRAALEGLFSQGRPGKVELAVLIERAHREFPIAADYVGLPLKTDRHQSVNVYLHLDPREDHAILEDHKYRTSQAS